MCEKWIDIEGYEGLYQVSSLGRVKSFHGRIEENKILKPSNPPSCPYTCFSLSKEKKHKSVRVHLLMARHFVPNPQNKPYVNHKDGDKTNPVADNLEWVTHKENIRHAWDTGLCVAPIGERNNAAKLTEAKVLEILSSSEKQRNLAKKYNVTEQMISRIKHRKAWKHLVH